MLGGLQCTDQGAEGKPQSGQSSTCHCPCPGPDEALYILSPRPQPSPNSPFTPRQPTTTHNHSSDARKLFSKTRVHKLLGW